MYPASLVIWYLYLRPLELFCGCICCYCCFKNKVDTGKAQVATSGSPAPSENEGASSLSDEEIATLTRQKSVEEEAAEYRRMEQFLGLTWSAFVQKFHKPLLVLFAILFGLGAFGASQMSAQTEDEQWFPPHHYLNFLFTWGNEFYRSVFPVLVKRVSYKTTLRLFLETLRRRDFCDG